MFQQDFLHNFSIIRILQYFLPDFQEQFNTLFRISLNTQKR